MTCQECGLRPASVHLTKVVNGHVEQTHLCGTCAQQKGEFQFFTDPASLLQNLLANFVGQEQVAEPKTEVRCSSCGFRFSEFRETGRLGCPACYTQFRSELEPMLRRLHGTTDHRGKLPTRRGQAFERTRRIQALRDRLQQAVQREEYETAAKLRDELKAAEAGGAS
ncbi:MAG: UvrB/UvrC motif-containing protein [Thermaerobacter sp.]|nr:UvrB/UvrC motif-containing protein [Thermaerobacter sp.]